MMCRLPSSSAPHSHVQPVHRLQHHVRPGGLLARRSGKSQPHGPHPRFRHQPAQGVRHCDRRERSAAERGRETVMRPCRGRTGADKRQEVEGPPNYEELFHDLMLQNYLCKYQ